jgi:energy-converting hydrogenase Eha subunit G
MGAMMLDAIAVIYLFASIGAIRFEFSSMGHRGLRAIASGLAWPLWLLGFVVMFVCIAVTGDEP